MAYSTPPYSAPFSHKRHDCMKNKNKVTEHETCVLFPLKFLSEIFLILGRRARWIKSVYYSACKVQVFLVRFQRNFNFLERFSKYTKTQNLMKILPMEADLYADERADRHDEANGCFLQFCERA